MKKSLIIIFFSLFIYPNLFAQTNLIQNGDFENSFNFWTLSPKFGVFGASPWCSGTHHALTADGAGNAYASLVNEYVSQNVTIPVNTTAATLNFCYKINTDNTSSGVNLKVWFGATVIATYTIANSNNLWQNASLVIANISNYLGQTIAIEFVANESASNAYWGKVYVDNVSLMVTTSNCVAVTRGPTQPQNQTASAGSTATFNTSVNGTAPYSYFWYKNGVFTGTSTSNTSNTSDSYTTPTLVYPNDNNNTYYCLITNCNSTQQVQSNTATLTVTQGCTLPTANFQANTPTTINQGGSVQFQSTASNNPDQWSWTFPGGTPSTSNSQSPTIQYNTPGVYNVTHQAHNSCGWGNSATTNNFITVNTGGSCTSPNASVNSPTGSSSVTMVCTASGGSGGSILYKWYNGNNCSGSSIGTGSTINVSSSGYYSCKAYINGYENSCFSCASGYATVNSSNNNITGTLYDYSTVNANPLLFQNATVELLNSSGGLLSSMATNSNGYFQFTGLSGSNYQIRVSKGSGASFVSGTTTGVNPGVNLAVVKLPYSLHQEALNANSSLTTHQFDYTLGYIFILPVTEQAFNTSLGYNYLTSSLASFNTNVNVKIEALQRLFSLTSTMKIVGDNGAKMLQHTIEEIISGVMTAFSIGSFVNKFNSLIAQGNINWFKWGWYELQKEILIAKIFIIEQTINVGISKYKNTELGSKLSQAVDISFALIKIKLLEGKFTEDLLQDIMNILVESVFTPLIYKSHFVSPIQSNLDPAITNIATLNYNNSTANAISRLNTIQTNSGSSYTQNYSDLVFYSTLSEGLLTGSKISALTRVLFLNPAALTATQFSSVLLGLASIASQGKAISSGLNGYLEQKDLANSACNTSTQRTYQNGYLMFQDTMLNDSLHTLFVNADNALSRMQNEDYSFESVMTYASADSNLNRKVFNLIDRLNNQLVKVGNEIQIDSFYSYLTHAIQNINLRSNLSWLVASKIGGFVDSKLNDSLSFYSAMVKENNIVADSVLNQGRIVSSSNLSPSYFTFEKIIYPAVIDTGLTIPVTIITRLHSDTSLSAQLFLSNYSDTIYNTSKIFHVNTNDTTQVLINPSSVDTVLTFRINTFSPEAVESSNTFDIRVQSLKTLIAVLGGTVLCKGDSSILIANSPLNFVTKWIETNSQSIVGLGDSLVVYAGFPGVYRAIYIDTVNTNYYYYSENSIAIENSVPDIGLDKSVIVLCSFDTTDIRYTFNTTGLSILWDVANPSAVGLGNYRLIVTNNVGCNDTANVSVIQETATWIGEVSNDWHNPLNWSRNHIPNDSTHVIINPSLYPCIVNDSDAVSASIQVKQGGIFQVNTTRNSFIKSDCDSLPQVGNLTNVSTLAVLNITSINAEAEGIVNNDGGTSIMERGICWNSSPHPTIANRFSRSGAGLGSFSCSLNGLNSNTTYYVRAYATNLAGTNYGNMDTFTTKPSPVTDIDGNFYPTTKICSEIWVNRNIEVTHYSNGDTIPQVQDPTVWSNLTTGAWCYYQNNTANGPVYGKLYNWYAVNDPRGLAPQGYHIPTTYEWANLSDTCLGGSTIAAGKMKTTGTIQQNNGLWLGNYNNSTNSSNFSGVPAGLRLPNGAFNNLGAAGVWWSSSESSSTNAWYREADMEIDDLSSANYSKKLGISVRCVKD